MSLSSFMRSAYRIKIDAADGDRALDFLVSHDIPFHGLRTDGEELSFQLYPPYYKEYLRLRGEERFAGEKHKRLGIMAFLAKYRKRTGFFVGMLLAAALLVTSSFFIWDIDVTGNERVSKKDIRIALENHGFMLGTFIPSLDKELIEKQVLLDVDGLSWISINLRGTVANVEVRERIAETETLDTQSPSNLIAKLDGQITALEVTGGVATVKTGQIVKKGDLLVSGIIDSNALGYRLVRARGEVYAAVTLAYHIEIPYEITEKVYTGVFSTKKDVKFFSKTIKLFGKDSISPSSCDKIEVERRIYLFDRIALPLFVVETTYSEYEMQTKTLTQKEAIANAYEELRRQSEKVLENADILSRHTAFDFGDEMLVMTEEVDCIINIAEEVKIETGA